MDALPRAKWKGLGAKRLVGHKDGHLRIEDSGKALLGAGHNDRFVFSTDL